MLKHCVTNAKLPAKDVDRALRFYDEKLGLRPAREAAPRHYLFEAGGTAFLLFPSEGRASGTHDQMRWVVTDIESEVGELLARGVTFEVFEMPGNTWTGPIADNGSRKSAWFRDSEGNLLNLFQPLGRPD